MSKFMQDDIDKLSDGLKRAAVESYEASQKLPEFEIAGWFFNASDGPQYFVGEPRATLAAHYKIQPLYFSAACVGQQPVAWKDAKSDLITPDRSFYRDDIVWRPLFLARYFAEKPK